MKRLLLLLSFAVLFTEALWASPPQSNYYLTSTAIVRSAAMGGAFTAIQDPIESAVYNPAALRSANYRGLYFYLNPAGAAAVALSAPRPAEDRRLTPSDLFVLLGTTVCAVSFSSAPFEAVILPAEESSGNPFRSVKEAELSVAGLLENHHHTAAFRLRPAKQISLGGALLFFNDTIAGETGYQYRRQVGSSYGVLVRPSDRFALGVSLFNVPEAGRRTMKDFYHIDHHYMNFGISWQPFDALSLAFDFRNVSHEDSLSETPFHGGMEIRPFAFAALRAGYYQNNTAQQDVIAVGLGIGDFRPPAEGQRERFVLSKFLLNYALQIRRAADTVILVHRASLLIRI